MYLQMCNVTIIFIFESYLTNINNNTLQKKKSNKFHSIICKKDI